MQIVQAAGPFKAGEPVTFVVPDTIYQTRYIRFGIQTPQAPPISEVNNFIEGMIRFKINGNEFAINENEILEFDNFYSTRIFTITPLQNLGRYSMIEVGFVDEIETE